jgi:hypothetical protein
MVDAETEQHKQKDAKTSGFFNEQQNIRDPTESKRHVGSVTAKQKNSKIKS